MPAMRKHLPLCQDAPSPELVAAVQDRLEQMDNKAGSISDMSNNDFVVRMALERLLELDYIAKAVKQRADANLEDATDPEFKEGKGEHSRESGGGPIVIGDDEKEALVLEETIYHDLFDSMGDATFWQK